MTSIMTNVASMTAMQNLNSVNTQLSKTQNRVATGLKVESAADGGGAFAVAMGLRGELKAMDAVDQQLSFGKGVLSVATEAAKMVSDTLNDVKNVLMKLADGGISGDQRGHYENEFVELMGEMERIFDNASFNGTNLIAEVGTDVDAISSTNGDTFTMANRNIETAIDNLAGGDADEAAAAAPANAAAAVAMLAPGGLFELAETTVHDALNGFGADTRRLDNLLSFNSDLRDATQSQLGSVVDADLGRESAMMQALQTKQQLSVQGLSMANQGPSSLLSLFRG